MIPGVEASSRRTQTITAPTTPRANQEASVFDQVIRQTSDWCVSFERMTWYVPSKLDTLLLANSDWYVSFASMPTFVSNNTNDLPTLLAATSDWAVTFKSMTRTDDLGFDDRMLSLIPDLYLPMVESVPYSESFDTVMLALSPDLFLPMIEETPVTDYSFDDTMMSLGPELFLPMIREDVN